MWMYSDFFAFPFSLAPAAFGVLCRSSQLQTSSFCIAFFLSPLCPLPCYSSDCCCVTCMTSVILLTFSSSTLTVLRFISLPCVSCAHAFSHCSRRGWGPDFWMFTQMCFISGAMLDEQNVITCWMYSSNYEFLFSCCISPSLSLCLLLQHIALWRAFCECLFSPLGCPSFFFNFESDPLRWSRQLQVEKNRR